MFYSPFRRNGSKTMNGNLFLLTFLSGMAAPYHGTFLASSLELFITEIADPDGVGNAGYVELYSPDGAGETIVDNLYFANWVEDVDPADDASNTQSLTGFTIPDDGFVIICKDMGEFNSNYPGVSCDFSLSFQIDGDDTVALALDDDNDGAINQNDDTIIDIYGEIGTDGSSFAQDYEDGRAERDSCVVAPTATFNVHDWNIDNDDQDGGTGVKTPDDMDPRVWTGACIICVQSCPAMGASDCLEDCIDDQVEECVKKIRSIKTSGSMKSPKKIGGSRKSGYYIFNPRTETDCETVAQAICAVYEEVGALECELFV